MELNDYIAKTREVTTPQSGIPVPDRTQQADFGLGLVRRMAEQSQHVPEAPTRMVPIVPLAN
jgi:hypothetical protein